MTHDLNCQNLLTCTYKKTEHNQFNELLNLMLFKKKFYIW